MKLNNILESIGKTDLVHLNRIGKGLELYAKLERQNPGASIKDRPAYQMIKDALESGELQMGGTIVEATSGNMGISLSMIGAVLGLSVVIVMPSSMSVERRQLMEAYGAQPVLVEKGGMAEAVRIAESLAREHGWFLVRQFENPSNPKAHLQTAAEILEDLPEVQIFVAGVGTAGTLMGTSNGLRDKGVKIVGVEPSSSKVLEGEEPGPHAIQGIGANFVPDLYEEELVDEMVSVTDEEAKEMARRLAKEEGILSGISSGANVAAALKYAEQGKVVVTVLPDTGERYLSTDLFRK